jgi:hypothetical protein
VERFLLKVNFSGHWPEPFDQFSHQPIRVEVFAWPPLVHIEL